MNRHLEPVPEPLPEEVAAFDALTPVARPAWWRWVALLIVIALVVATPFAYALYRLLA